MLASHGLLPWPATSLQHSRMSHLSRPSFLGWPERARLRRRDRKRIDESFSFLSEILNATARKRIQGTLEGYGQALT